LTLKKLKKGFDYTIIRKKNPVILKANAMFSSPDRGDLNRI